MISKKTKPIYVCSNGEEFFTLKDAKERELKIQLNKWADDCHLCRGGEWCDSMVLDQIYKDRKRLMEIFKNYAGRIHETE